MENSLTIPSVLNSKVATYLEKRTFRQMVRDMVISVTIFLAAGLLINADVALPIIKWRNGLVPTLVLVMTVETHARWLLRSLRDLFRSLRPQVESIEGIPTVELLDWLFTRGSLKVKEATAAFRVPQHRVEALAKKLREIEVLVPGACNASVLNPAYSRQDVASIFEGREAASDLRPLFRREGNRMTSEPSGKDILSRVEAALAPLSDELTPPPRASGFITRLVTDASQETRMIPA